MKDWYKGKKEDGYHPTKIGRTDIYWIYKQPLYLVEEEYKNEWFKGNFSEDKHGIYEKIITVKVCDIETASHLYNRNINPLSISIAPYIKYENRKYKYVKDLYQMKVQLHSIDDSSYGIWFMGVKLPTLKWLRDNEIKKWVDNQEIINGNELLTFCESIGGIDKDYN